MAKPLPGRPEKDFRVTTFQLQVDIEATHRDAGFPAIPREVLSRRFWQFVDFLQRNELTSRTIAFGQADIRPETELRNSDLTEFGYRFVQKFGDRWIARMYKDTGEIGEAKFLTKWLRQLNKETGVEV
jgi:hypothetical protein